MIYHKILTSWPIRRKMLLLLLVIFLPALLIIITSGLNRRGDEIAKAKENALLVVHSLAAQQEQIASTTEVMLNTLAQLPEVQSQNREACSKLFRDLHERYPFYSVIVAVTPDGKTFASSRPFKPNIDLSDRKYVRDAIRTLDFSVGEYIVGRISNVQSLNYALPVLDEQKRLRAILIAGFSLNGYAPSVTKANLPEGYAVTIADWKGVRLFRFPESSRAAPGIPLPPGAISSLSGKHDQGFYEITSHDGQDRIYAFRRLRLHAESPPYLYMLVGVPQYTILHKANLKMAGELLILGIAALVAMSLLWLFGNMLLIRPMNRLVASVRRFGQGEMGTRTGLPHTPDELGRLAETFDEMASQIETKNAELETRVQERTAELSASNAELQVEIAERKRAEEAIRFNAERVASLLTLNQMSGATQQEITDYALEEAVRLTRSEIGYLAFLNSDETILTMHSWSKKAMQGCDITDKPIRYPVKETGLWGEAVRQRRSVITNDYPAPNPLKKGYPEGHVPISSHMNVPIFVGDHIVLVAGVGNKRNEYSEMDVKQLTLLMEGMWRHIEHERAEDELEESRRRLSDIIEFLPDATMVVDKEGKVIAWNRAMEAMTGVKAEEMLGKGDHEYAIPFYGERRPILIDAALHPNPEIEKRYMAFRRTGDVISGEIHAPNLPPGDVHLSVTTSVLRNSQGEVIAAIGCSRNDTDRRKLEAQLQQAQKLEAIGTLAGGIAHDFNNLLMAIQGNTSLILMKTDPSDHRYELLRTIEEQVITGADLTKQLLGFARSGRYEVKSIDMNEVLEKSATMFGRTKKEIMIHKKYAPALWPVEADISQMDQVLLNLYVNAWQAMPGGGHVYLETSNLVAVEADAKNQYLKPGRYVRISVTDTGMGMDEHTKARLFEPFFTTKEMGRGTGLGLAMVYGIVRGHHGYINVYSEKGKGTTFNIYLPASEKAPGKDEKPAETILKGEETILLVDDEEAIINVLKEILEALGYSVLTAVSGPEAMILYEENKDRIDLVILDMILPEMGGGEVFDLLKEINREIKVILSSGYSLNGEAAGIMARGCQGFIQKPVSIAELSKKIRNVLGKAEPR